MRLSIFRRRRLSAREQEAFSEEVEAYLNEIAKTTDGVPALDADVAAKT